MDLFLRRLPANQRKRAIERQLNRAIKSLFGKKIEVNLSTFKDRTRAILTFPYRQLAQRFLAHYTRVGLLLRDRAGKYLRISIDESRYEPKVRLVQALRERMKETESESSGTDEGSTSRKRVPFETIKWGVWDKGGIFGHCGTIEKKGELSYNSRSGELEANWFTESFGDDRGIIIDNITIREILLDERGDLQRLFLTLDRLPRFWSVDPAAHRFAFEAFNFASLVEPSGEVPKYRLPALSHEHAATAPYCTVYVFEGSNVLINLSGLAKSMKRDKPHNALIHERRLDLTSSLKCLNNLYSKYHYRLAFQIDLLVRNCLLIPSEVCALSPEIDMLLDKHDLDTIVYILERFSSRLSIRTFELLSEGLNIHSSLAEAVKFCCNYQPEVSADGAWIHRVDIMPCGYNLEGPEWMGSNRILRMFPEDHDQFLKVSFTEEDLTRIRQNREYEISVIVEQRWGDILSSGVKVAGRRFEFLGFSLSSLKEHSVWFMCPFKREGRMITTAALHRELGDFSKIRCAPRFAARLGQTFTSTSHSLEIDPDREIRYIDDIKTGDFIFSDGVGTISESMMRRIWSRTGVEDDTVKPVVYQIRLGGSKGVVSLDKTLKEDLICLRPSMTKFEAKNTHLELANKGRPLPFFLNKQLIVILETLGVQKGDLFGILKTELEHLKKASTHFDEAVGLCQRYGLGHASSIQAIFETLRLEEIGKVLQIPFFRRIISLVIAHALKQIKYKSRINVGASWKLIGIMDEFDHLEEGQVYVCVRDDRTGSVQYLEGKTLVTRSPALHCGDVRIVHAIGQVDPCHPLAALHNCIVFAPKGQRPIPDMISGGDLDGDLFDVSQNPALFPPKLEPPDSYPTLPPKETDRDCTVDDIIEFFLNFIVNDNLGQLCTRHSLFADQSPTGALSENCVKLSRLASIAVDFPKTGRPVDMKEAPWIETWIKPDFMAQYPLREEDYVANNGQTPSPSKEYSGTRPDRRHYYPSTKVLGHLYRYVDIQKLVRMWTADVRETRSGSETLWNRIESNLRKLVPVYEPLWPSFLKEAQEIFEIYVEDLEDIQRRCHPTPWRAKSLSEHEVFTQCIIMDPLTKSVRGRGKEDFLKVLQSEYRKLVEWVKAEIWRTAEGRFQRAAAYFYVGINSPKRRPQHHGESFAWIVVPDVFAAWRSVECSGYMDGEDEGV